MHSLISEYSAFMRSVTYGYLYIVTLDILTCFLQTALIEYNGCIITILAALNDYLDIELLTFYLAVSGNFTKLALGFVLMLGV